MMSNMERKNSIDGKLAVIAIQRYKSDKAIQAQFKNVSEYYDWLKVKVHSALTIEAPR